MNTNQSYIIKNISGAICEFYINEDDKLIFNKFSKETVVLENVSEFNVNISHLGVIEVVCITLDGCIKYCKFDKKWVVQTLYKLDSSDNIIREVTLFSKNDTIHIFFIFYTPNDENKENILHYLWDGKKFHSNFIASINSVSDLSKHYHLEIYDNTLNMFYMTSENGSNVVNLCKYSKNTWTPPTKLYRLNGFDINFTTLHYNKKFNILNLSRENTIWTLDHVMVDKNGILKSLTIHKTANKIIKTTFLVFDKKLYCMWLENDFLFYSLYDNNKWSKPRKVNTESFENVDIYRYTYEKTPWQNTIQAKNLFASISSSSEINLFLPDMTKTYNNKNSENYDAESTIRKLLERISNKDALIYNLKNEKSIITEKLKQKDSYIKEVGENINLLAINKSDMEKNYKAALQLNDSLTDELNDLKDELEKKIEENIAFSKNIKNSSENVTNNVQQLEDKVLKLNKKLADQQDEFDRILKQKEEQFNNILNQNKKLENIRNELKLENSSISEKLQQSNSILLELQSKYDAESSNIKKELENNQKNFEYITNYTEKLEKTLKELKSENFTIKEQLENCKNKSFLDRFFK